MMRLSALVPVRTHRHLFVRALLRHRVAHRRLWGCHLAILWPLHRVHERDSPRIDRSRGKRFVRAVHLTMFSGRSNVIVTLDSSLIRPRRERASARLRWLPLATHARVNLLNLLLNDAHLRRPLPFGASFHCHGTQRRVLGFLFEPHRVLCYRPRPRLVPVVAISKSRRRLRSCSPWSRRARRRARSDVPPITAIINPHARPRISVRGDATERHVSNNLTARHVNGRVERTIPNGARRAMRRIRARHGASARWVSLRLHCGSLRARRGRTDARVCV